MKYIPKQPSPENRRLVAASASTTKPLHRLHDLGTVRLPSIQASLYPLMATSRKTHHPARKPYRACKLKSTPGNASIQLSTSQQCPSVVAATALLLHSLPPHPAARRADASTPLPDTGSRVLARGRGFSCRPAHRLPPKAAGVDQDICRSVRWSKEHKKGRLASTADKQRLEMV